MGTGLGQRLPTGIKAEEQSFLQQTTVIKLDFPPDVFSVAEKTHLKSSWTPTLL